MLEITTPTADQVREFVGKQPGNTARWLAGVEDGRVVALFGLVLAGAYWLAVYRLREGLDPSALRYRRMIAAGARRLFGGGWRSQLPLVAYADDRQPGARALLEHYGFQRTPTGAYMRSAA